MQQRESSLLPLGFRGGANNRERESQDVRESHLAQRPELHKNRMARMCREMPRWTMPAIPKADAKKRATRPAEVLGFRRYCEAIVSWLSLVDPCYTNEVMEVFARSAPLGFRDMSSEQVMRSQRLFHILKQSQSTKMTSRWEIIIYLYEAQNTTEPGNGYELLRTLRVEIGLKTRSECMHFKSSVLDFKFLNSCDLQDNLRRLDAEVFR